ncbi:hypothetical protein S4A8_14959 [Salinisphaera sp. S4-8]|uniref:hypothetical protein n=1 Tax=Salinisphaera sp. S4-8 TaxID=633357 RepID=UPI0033411FA8
MNIASRCDRQALRQGLAGGGAVDWAMSGFLRPGNSVVVTGFWRSGTTFLLEQLTQLWRAKPVFEPFQPELPGYRAVLDTLVPATMERGRTDHYLMPYALDDSLARYVSRVLRYGLVDVRIQRSRSNLSAHGRGPRGVPESIMQHGLAMRPRVVAKFVRGALLVPALRQRLAVPVFHIRRCPHGVLASYKSAGWQDFQADRIGLRRLLLEIDDGRAAFFAPMATLIDELDKGNADQRLVAYWALTEKFVDAHAEHYIKVPYEALATGEFDLAARLAQAGFDVKRARSDGFNSSTTSAHRAHLSARERVDSWRHKLSDEQIRQVDDIVARVGVRG